MPVTHRDREYRVRVHERGAVNIFTDTVDFILDSELVEPPTIGGTSLQPLQSRILSTSTVLRVVDENEIVSGNLSDSDGRLSLIGRVAQIQIRDNGGEWKTLFTGRISDVELGNEVVDYLIHISDELWMLRNNEVFKEADTTQIHPPGIRWPWRGDNRVATGVARLASMTDATFSRQYYEFLMASPWGVSPSMKRWIDNDVKDDAEPVWEDDSDRIEGEGNFKYLRAKIKGVDFEVICFGELKNENITEGLSDLQPAAPNFLRFYIIGPDDFIPVSDVGGFFRASLYAPGAPPSDAVPLHVGTDVGTNQDPHQWGEKNRWELTRKILNKIGARYSGSSLDDLSSSPSESHITSRITSPWNALEFLEREVWEPARVAPFIGDEGQIVLKSTKVPSNDPNDPNYVDLDNIFEFDKSHLIEPHITWDHSSRDLKNRVIGEYKSIKKARFTSDEEEIVLGSQGNLAGEDFAADRYHAEDAELERDYDNQDILGPREYRISLESFRQGGLSPSDLWSDASALNLLNVHRAMDEIAEEIFARWGDGPIRGTLHATWATDDQVESGDFVRINLESFPNPIDGGQRGGGRIVQITTKKRHPDHIEYEFLDAGPDAQPLNTPSVSIAKNTDRSRHVVDVSISNVPDGATATIRIGYGDTEPTIWPIKISSLGDETVSVPKQPGGTKVWVQVQARKRGRIRSSWSVAASVTTDPLPAPTADSTTVAGAKIILDFTPGTENYRIMPVAAKTPDSTEDWIDSSLPSSHERYVFDKLDLSTEYEVGVKHVDPYGGESAVSSLTATTEATPAVLNEPRRVQILQGRGTTADDISLDEEQILGYGLQIRWRPVEEDADTRVQVAEDSSFTTIIEELKLPPGVSAMMIELDLVDALRYIRIRHEKDNYTDSNWSATVSAKPTQLLKRAKAEDLFPGGWAELTIDEDGKLRRHVGSDDGDVDRAYWEITVNPATPGDFPDVDENSSFDDSSNFPINEIVQSGGVDVEMSIGDEAVYTVRFWNETSGFGQTTRRRIVRDTRKSDAMTGRLHTVVNDSTVDLYATVIGGFKRFPITGEIYEDDPSGVALLSHEFNTSGETIGPTGSGEDSEYAALTDIALPRKATKRWWMKLTDDDGDVIWSGFTAADRDKIPGGGVTTDDNTREPKLECAYDEDVEEIVVTTPGGKTKTFSNLSGGGKETYQVGVTALDDTSTEDTLTFNETRTGYKVEYKGSGTTITMFEGPLHGPRPQLRFAAYQWRTIGGSEFEVAPTVVGYRLVVGLEVGEHVKSIHVEATNQDGTSTYDWDISADGKHTIRDATDGYNPLNTLSWDHDSSTASIKITPYDETGGKNNGSGSAGPSRTLEPSTPPAANSGESIEDQDGTVVSGDFLTLDAAYNVTTDANDRPQLVPNSPHDVGTISSSPHTLDYSNSAIQRMTLGADITIDGVNNLPSGGAMHFRAALSGNTLTFDGTAFEGHTLSFDGTDTSWLIIVDTGATKLSVIAGAGSSHTHDASDITSGAFPVSRGGTGITNFANPSEILYSNDQGDLTTLVPTLPDDNGKFLRLVSGSPAWRDVTATSVNAEDVNSGVFEAGNWTFAGTGNVRLGNSGGPTDLQFFDDPGWHNVLSTGGTLTLTIGATGWTGGIDMVTGSSAPVNINGNEVLTEASSNIGLLDQNETITGDWTFDGGFLHVGGQVRIRGGANSSFSNPGQIALKRSTGDPYFSFHDSDGTRRGYLQFRSGNASRLNSENGEHFDIQVSSSTKVRVKSGNMEFPENGYRIQLKSAENSFYEVGASQNEISGITVRATTNPSSGNPLFTVESSGSATRFLVEHSTGSVKAPTGNFFDSSSIDQKDIEGRWSGDALEIIRNTDLWEYTYKGDHLNMRKVGFVAEWVHPMLVDETQTMKDINNVLGLLMGSTQQLADRADTNSEDIEQLKYENEILRNRVDELERAA